MAIGKKNVNETGQSATYHRIIEQTADIPQGQIHIVVASYTDKSFRENEKADERLIADNIAALNSEYSAAEKRKSEIEEEMEVLGKRKLDLQNEIQEVSDDAVAALIQEHETISAELQTLGEGDEARIREIEAREVEINKEIQAANENKVALFSQKADAITVIDEEAEALRQEANDIQKHLMDIISTKQQWESAAVNPRYVETQKYTLPLSDADMRDIVYSKLMELEPFNGSKEV